MSRGADKKELVAQENVFKLLFEAAAEGLIVADKQGKIIMANPRAYEMFDYDQNEIIGQMVEFLIPDKHKKKHPSLRKEYVKHPSKRSMGIGLDLMARRKDGSEFPVEISLNHFSSEKNIRVMALITDVTERKKVEEHLHQTEAALRSLHNISSDQQLKFDKKIQRFLKLGCHEFGLPTGILSKIEGNDYIVEQVVAHKNTIKKGDVFAVDDTYCNTTIQNEEPFYVEHVSKSDWHAHPCYQKFKLEAYIGMRIQVGNKVFGTLNFSSTEPRTTSFSTTDQEILKLMAELVGQLIERKEYEDKLQHLNKDLEVRIGERTQELDKAISALKFSNEEMQEEMKTRIIAEKRTRLALEKEKELGELKSRFVSMASHEFRTPLSTVLSSVSLIAKYNDPTDEEKRNKHITRIKSSVNNLTSILTDFLSLDKLQEGKVDNNPASFNLIDFSRDVVDDMQAIAKTNQKIIYKHEGRKKHVHLDKNLLRNILINLLSNAIKYSPEDKNVAFTTNLSGSSLDIVVKDQGMGIPEKDQKHMFERFFRAKNSTHIQGTGLGLNIVKKYLELMGGDITFTSTEGKGTIFIIKLPQNA